MCLAHGFIVLLTVTNDHFPCLCFPADIISTVEFNYSGELLATGDKGGRVVIFQREQEVSCMCVMFSGVQFRGHGSYGGPIPAYSAPPVNSGNGEHAQTWCLL